MGKHFPAISCFSFFLQLHIWRPNLSRRRGCHTIEDYATTEALSVLRTSSNVWTFFQCCLYLYKVLSLGGENVRSSNSSPSGSGS
ncbi:hypothetical protein GOP47_0027443 [Adiantum capillus-veneris]|nr:hypothetical protein GOP47_0027443 [Adiantum capillus-veneris]